MHKQKMFRSLALMFGIMMLIVFIFSALPAMADGPVQRTASPVFWTWESPEQPRGTSQLNRGNDALHATLSTSELPAHQAMTLWFIVFNNPQECQAGPYNCTPADLGANRPAEGDFLSATGNVVGESGRSGFAGSLKVGDISGSGLKELPGECVPGYEGCGGPVGLKNPEGALVILAVHSHGPKQTGMILKSQLSSYLGGCQQVIGSVPGGFAAGPEEVPVNVGDCSTIQISPHMP